MSINKASRRKQIRFRSVFFFTLIFEKRRKKPKDWKAKKNKKKMKIILTIAVFFCNFF